MSKTPFGMGLRLLLIEDDTRSLGSLNQIFSECGFSVALAHDGEEGLNLTQKLQPDIILMNFQLRKLDGPDLIEKIRALNSDTPLMILSAQDSVDDRVRGLEKGADDFLPKPFSVDELLARVRALLRRRPRKATKLEFDLECESIEMDLNRREVRRGGKLLELQAKEYLLFEHLLQNPGYVLTKSQILEKIWGYTFDPQTNVVDVLVCRLRNKVDKNFAAKIIHTIRGVGYVLKKI